MRDNQILVTPITTTPKESVPDYIRGAVDTFFNPELYYSESDVRTINIARKHFLKTFTESNLPIYLRYGHESGLAADHPSLRSETPIFAHRYQPSQKLHKEYSITETTFGTNQIARMCKKLVSNIYIYLTQLNEKTKSVKAKLPNRHYGHPNDSVRVIFLLIVTMLIELSSADLTSHDAAKKSQNNVIVQFGDLETQGVSTLDCGFFAGSANADISTEEPETKKRLPPIATAGFH